MSHLSRTYLPWPPLPAPRSQAEADAAWADGGAGPSNPDDWAAALAVISSSPEGVPLPVGWDTADVRLDVDQGGALYLSLSRVVRVGEGEDEGKTWGESVALLLHRVQGEMSAAVSTAYVSTWTSGRTRAELARDEQRLRQQELIRSWANSSSACTIPWGPPLGKGRRDIADCVDACLILTQDDTRRPDIRAVISEALDLYPVAAPGLRALLVGLGLGAEFGLS